MKNLNQNRVNDYKSLYDNVTVDEQMHERTMAFLTQKLQESAAVQNSQVSQVSRVSPKTRTRTKKSWLQSLRERRQTRKEKIEEMANAGFMRFSPAYYVLTAVVCAVIGLSAYLVNQGYFMYTPYIDGGDSHTSATTPVSESFHTTAHELQTQPEPEPQEMPDYGGGEIIVPPPDIVGVPNLPPDLRDSENLAQITTEPRSAVTVPAVRVTVRGSEVTAPPAEELTQPPATTAPVVVQPPRVTQPPLPPFCFECFHVLENCICCETCYHPQYRCRCCRRCGEFHRCVCPCRYCGEDYCLCPLCPDGCGNFKWRGCVCCYYCVNDIEHRHILGDINGDGFICLSDAHAILRHHAGLAGPLDGGPGTAPWEAALIVNTEIPDGRDIMQIIRYVFRLPSALDDIHSGTRYIGCNCCNNNCQDCWDGGIWIESLRDYFVYKCCCPTCGRINHALSDRRWWSSTSWWEEHENLLDCRRCNPLPPPFG